MIKSNELNDNFSTLTKKFYNKIFGYYFKVPLIIDIGVKHVIKNLWY